MDTTERYNHSSPGELIKHIRKSLDLKQHEIVDESLTRNLVSLIENNKAPLTQNATNVILRCMNVQAEKKGLVLRIEELDLTKPGVFDTKLQVCEHLTQFTQLMPNQQKKIAALISDINELLHSHALGQLSVYAYLEIGNFYYKHRFYEKANLYYSQAFDHVHPLAPSKDRMHILKKLAKTYLKTSNINKCLYTVRLALSTISENEDHSEWQFLNIKALYELRDYDACLKAIKALKSDLPKQSPHYFELMIIYSHVLLQHGDHLAALKILESLLNAQITMIQTTRVYCELIRLHIQTNEISPLQLSVQKLLSILSVLQSDAWYHAEALFQVACAYRIMKETENSFNHYIKCIAVAKSAKHLSILESALCTLGHPEFSQFISIDELYILCRELIDLGLLRKESPMPFTMIRYFSERNTQYASLLVNALERYFIEHGSAISCSEDF